MVSRLAGALVVLELLALAIVGWRVSRDDAVFGPIDERAHYAFVQFVAEEGRLPLLRDHNRPEVLALSRGTYPVLPDRDAELMGIWGKVYEAFQPPLYYVVAAAVSRVAPDHRAQVTVLRLLGVTLLFGLAAVLARLARVAGPEEWTVALAFLLNVALFPGIVVRAVHVGNAGLEILLGTLFVLCTFRGLEEGRVGWFGGAACVLGAALLTRVTAVSFVPLFALALLVAVRRGLLGWGRAGATLMVPALFVAPWLAFNLVHYGALTANSVARGMQMHLINPDRTNFALRDAAVDFWSQMYTYHQLFLPQEWTFGLGTAASTAITVGSVVLFVVPLLVWPFLSAAVKRNGFLFALPLPLSCLLCVSTYAVADWPMVVRYVYASLPAAMVLAFFALRRIASPAVALVVSAALFALIAVAWVARPLPV